jgi:hypothetical protein
MTERPGHSIVDTPEANTPDDKEPTGEGRPAAADRENPPTGEQGDEAGSTPDTTPTGGGT